MEISDILSIHQNEGNWSLLDKIYINVCWDYFPNDIYRDVINKISNCYKNNFEKVLSRLEISSDFQMNKIMIYILECSLNNNEKEQIETMLTEWGVFYKKIGVIDDFKKQFIDKYRKYYVLNCVDKYKERIKKSQYMDFCIYLRKIIDSDKDEQIGILDRFKEENKEKSYDFIELLSMLGIEYRLDRDNGIKIDSLFTERFKMNCNLIKKIYDIHFKAIYNKYFSDLKKIYSIQQDLESWVNIDRIDKLVSNININLLKEACLVKEINYNDNRIIKLTEIGYSIVENQFIERWESEQYFIETDNIVLIPCDYNPVIINKYLFNNQYKLKRFDYLLIFEKITKG